MPVSSLLAIRIQDPAEELFRLSILALAKQHNGELVGCVGDLAMVRTVQIRLSLKRRSQHLLSLLKTPLAKVDTSERALHFGQDFRLAGQFGWSAGRRLIDNFGDLNVRIF